MFKSFIIIVMFTVLSYSQDTVVLDDQYIVDSLTTIVETDSLAEIALGKIYFKKQLNVKVTSINTKLQCVEFLLEKKLRTNEETETYLECLLKLSDAKRDLYYAARKVVPDEQKYLAVAYMKKSRAESNDIQILISKFKR